MSEKYAVIMKCEMCDREGKLRRAIIEGVEMNVCQDCVRYGTIVDDKKTTTHMKPKKKAVPYSKDLFKEMNQFLVSDWGKKISKARENKQLTREQLGSKVGEKTVTIAKIENEELRPPDETIKRIEKELEISLFQKIEEGSLKRTEAKGFTIGDLLKNAK